MLVSGAFGRYWDHEDGALMNEICALVKNILELHTHFCHVDSQGEVSQLEESPYLNLLTPWLYFPTSRIVRNKFLLFTSLFYFVIAA